MNTTTKTTPTTTILTIDLGKYKSVACMHDHGPSALSWAWGCFWPGGGMIWLMGRLATFLILVHRMGSPSLPCARSSRAIRMLPS
jgi:hypothetical protein